MSIGRKLEYVSIENVTTGEIFKFNVGKMHIQNSEIMIDAEGDDVAKALYNKYGITNTFVYFRFNKLVGCFLRYYCDTASLVVLDLYISGHEHESRTDYHKNWGLGISIDGASYANYVMCGMYFVEMANNVLIEGPNVYMFPFISANDNGMLTKGVADFPYKMPTNYNQTLSTGNGYLYSPFSDSFTECPYILKNYNRLGFSDSGDIKKQYVTTEYGFPFGPDETGESKSRGGQGTMKDTSEDIPIEDARIIFGGRMSKIYEMNVVELSQLENFLLSPEYTTQASHLFAEPMDYIISLNAMPFSAEGTTATVSVGSVDTGVSAKQLSNLIYDIDCGSIPFTEFYCTFMDYAPYTRISLVLPYIGIRSVNIDAFQNDSLGVKYRIDMLTGSCVGFIYNSHGIVDMATGNVAYNLPLRSSDFQQMYRAALSLPSSVVGSLSSGNVISGIGGTAISAMGSFKPSIAQSGSISGNSGVLMNRKPYLIIERPKISVPETYAHNTGYVSRISTKLSSLHGYTVVESIHLDNVEAIKEEKEMLERILKSGVIL